MLKSHFERKAKKDSEEEHFKNFFECIEIGLISVARFYLGLNRKLLTCINSKGYTALMCAVMNDDADTAAFLLEAGADAKVATFLGYTPLEAASKCGYESVVIQILTSVPNIGKQKSLFQAVEKGHENIVTLLIAAGADVNITDYIYRTALCHSIEHGHERVFKLLLDAGADPFQISGGGASPLDTAALKGNLAIVAQLLALGAEVDSVDRYGNTPLHMAAYLGNDLVVAQLIIVGADVNKHNRSHRTPLHGAAINGYEKVVKQLLVAGANANIPDELGETPLYHSAHRNHIDTVRLLIDDNAKITKKIISNVGRCHSEMCDDYATKRVKKMLTDALAYVSDSSRHTTAAIKVSNLSSLPMLIKLEIVSRLVGKPGLNDYQVTQILK